jgi:hypothetical protein
MPRGALGSLAQAAAQGYCMVSLSGFLPPLPLIKFCLSLDTFDSESLLAYALKLLHRVISIDVAKSLSSISS